MSDTPSRREEDVVPPDRLASPTNRERIEQMKKTLDAIQMRFERFVSRAMTIMIALALLCSISIGGFVYALNRRGHDVTQIQKTARTSSATARTAARLAKRTTEIANVNRTLVTEIQAQRREQSRTACNARNAQNKGTLRVLRRFKISDPMLLKGFPITHDCSSFARKAAP